MTFLKKRRNNTFVNIEGIYVSSYKDITRGGLRCVEWYFLATCEDGEYYELFSGKKLEKEADTHDGVVIIQEFDTPYVEKAEPLREYFKDDTKDKIDIQSLFDFITNMNVLGYVGAFSDDSVEGGVWKI